VHLLLLLVRVGPARDALEASLRRESNWRMLSSRRRAEALQDECTSCGANRLSKQNHARCGSGGYTHTGRGARGPPPALDVRLYPLSMRAYPRRLHKDRARSRDRGRRPPIVDVPLHDVSLQGTSTAFRFRMSHLHFRTGVGSI
jgi:hypothetical protein